MAEAMDFKPQPIPFPEESSRSVSTIVEQIDEKAIRTYLLQSQPVDNVLLWLHQPYGHYSDATLLRLYNSLVYEEDWSMAPTSVLGCAGKGVNHDYTYFAYQGQLDVEDFRLPNGAVVQEPQLNPHFERLGKVVYRYDSTEFTAALYGGQSRRTQQGPDFTVFKLELTNHDAVFQKVLARTLRLDKLKSEEVKEYLLEVFKRDLGDANVDFKAEWEKSFAKVNKDRAQYKAAVALKGIIESLEADHNRRLELRGDTPF